MPFLIPAAIAIGSSIGAGLAAAGTALGVAGAALVAGDFALAGTALLAVGDASLIGGFTVGSVLEVGALAGISALLAPHPAVNNAGSPQQFKPDPNAGLPVVMGRYGVGGNLVYETTSGGGNDSVAGAKGNEYLTSFVILSALGPVQAFETLRFNDTILTFDSSGQGCNGGYIPYDEVQEWNPGYRHQNSDGSYINNNYQDRAWQNLQLGALDAGYFAPPTKITSDNAGLPEWTQAHGFSGFCAASLTLVYDQRYYAGGVPQYQWVLQGIKIYDPRLDTTYSGGSGSQRWAGQGASAAAITAARGTWTFSQNPWIHALNFALGHFLPDAQTGPGRLYAGIGAGVTGVDIAAFVRAANIADANNWLICGQWTTGDGKWSVLTEMAKAGSGSIVIKNGIISCIVDTPLTSVGTVTADDLSGPITLPTGASFTARLNTIFPRFTSEAHRWQMVQADTPVKAATYVAEDGAVRSKTLDWQYVPAVNQACQLAAYTITNGREISGITLPGKPKLRNYDVGDCFTLDIPEAGLATTKVLVTRRVTDWSTGAVTLTVRTETDAKHAYSLGISGVAPATPAISGYDPTIVEAPLPDFWATGILEASDPITGEARSIIQVTGSAADNIYAKFVDIRWRPVAQVNGIWTPTGDSSWSYTQQSALQGRYPLDLNPGSYDVQIAYTTVSGAYPSADEDWLDLGVETVGGSTAANTANVGSKTAGEVESAVDQVAAATAAFDAAATQIQAATDAANAAAQAVNEAADAAGSNAEQLEDAAEGALSGALQQLDQLLALHATSFTATGLPIGPFSVETATNTATANSTLAVMGQVTPDGSGFILNNQGVYYANGQTLSQLVTQLSSATNAVSATLTSSYLTATQTNSAISAAKTTLQASINSVSATLTTSYLTSAQTTAAISAAQNTLQASINGVSATLTSSYMTSAQTTAAISTAQTTLQASINGVSATLTNSYLTAASTTAAIAQAQTTLQASINGVSSTLTNSYLTSAQTTQAISQAQTTLQSSINGVSASLTNNYLTSAQTNSAISAAQLTLQSNINSLSATLTNNYMTSASTTSAISSAQSTLQAGINGVGATVSTQGSAIANLQGQASGSLKFSVTSGTNVASLQILAASGGGQNISAVQIRADQFQLVDGYGTSFFELNNKFAFLNTRLYVGNSFWIDPVTSVLYAENGNSLLMLGQGFGPSGNMLLWSGPANTDPSQASRSNAYLCLDGNGLYVAPSGNQPVSKFVTATGLAASGTASAEVYNFSTGPGIKGGGTWQATVFFGPNGGQAISASGANVPVNWTLYENGTGVLLTSGTFSLGSNDGDPVSVNDPTSNFQIVGNSASGTVQLNLYMSCQVSNQSFSNLAAHVGVIWTPGTSS